MDERAPFRRWNRLSGVAVLLLLSGCSILRWQEALSLEGASASTATEVDPWRQGDWRLNRQWSPLASLQKVRRSGLKLSTQRWQHPASEDWNRRFFGPISRQIPGQASARDLTPQAGHTRVFPNDEGSDVLLTEVERLPFDVRIHLAIFLSERHPEVSRHAADLEPVVTTGKRHPATDPLGISNLIPQSSPKTARAKDNASEMVSETTRLAAARAWCFQRVGKHCPEGELETLLKPVGQVLASGSLPESVHAELLRTLGQWLPPGRIPTLADSLTDDPAKRATTEAIHVDSVEAALEAGLEWLVQQQSRGVPLDTDTNSDAEWWRRQIEQLERPDSPRERLTYDANLVLLGDLQVGQRLAAELPTREWSDRERIAVLMGLAKGTDGIAALRQMQQQSEDGPRLLALRGLSTTSEFIPEVFADMSPRLRAALADCLAEHDPEAGRSLSRQLIVDPHSQVADAMLIAVGHWPARDAIPVLLTGLVEGSYKTRRDSWRRLQELQGPFAFSIDGVASDRRDAALALRKQWEIAEDRLTSLSGSSESRRRNDPERERLLMSLLERREEWAGPKSTADGESESDSVWSRFTDEDVPFLEQLLETAPPDLRQFLGDELLPRLSPAYLAFRDLRSTQVSVRRKAAAGLRDAARPRSLPAPILHRLVDVIREEQDLEVWRSTFLAVENEASNEAALLARTAAETSWPDLRLLALDYVARHRPREAGQWVLPLLAERHPRVQIEAVKVAGLLGDPALLEGTRDAEGTVIYPGLRAMLPGAEGQLRWAVILSLGQLGDSQGLDELLRLARDQEPLTRASAIRAMGETGQSRFVQPLLDILWTESSPTVQSAGLTSLGHLVPADRHPRQDAASPYTERLQAWADATRSQ